MNHNMEEDNIKDEDEAKGPKTILIKEEVILSDDEEEFGVDIKIETNEDSSLLNKGGCSPSREANIEISVPAVCVTELETCEEPNTSDPLCNNIDLSNATNNIKCKPIQTYSSVGAKKHSRYLCSFKGCGRKMAAFSSLHFYNFPVHKPYICQLWVTNSENEVLATLEKNNLSSRVVCEKHFESKCFTSAMKLNPWAVPTVPFLEESITEPKQVGTPNSEMEDGNVAEELNTIYIKEEAIFSDEELDEDVKVEATEDPLQMNEGSCSPSNKDKIETSTPSVQEREQETCEEPNTSNELTTKKFVCKLCERSFSSAFHLKEHAIIHTKPFKCNFCDESFLIRMQLVDHLNKTHAEKKPLNCELCDRFFSKKADLTRHLKTHYGGKAYKICEICDKKFSKFCNLTRHIRTHPCNCEICDKRFSVRSELIRHLSIHTGEKPFICGVCEKRFSLKLLLIDHLRTHTGERPYKCGFCDKSFSQIGNLDRHIGTHTGSYECEVCNQCFAEKKHLTQHSRIHHGQLAFECGFCKLKYARSNTLIKHIKLAHWRSLDFVKFVT